MLPHVRYIHSVASDSALAQLGKHGNAATRVLIEVNVAGDGDKSGIAPAELPAFIERCPVTVVGLMTMPPLASRPGATTGATSRRCASSRSATACASFDGHEPGLRGGRGGGRDDHPPRLVPLPARTRHNQPAAFSREISRKPEPPTDMAFRDTWHRTLVYFGLAEDEAYDDDFEPYSEPEVQMQDNYRDRPTVRRLETRPRRRRDEFDDIFGDEGDDRRTTVLRPVATRPRRAATVTCACTSSHPRTSTTPRTWPTSSRTRFR